MKIINIKAEINSTEETKLDPMVVITGDIEQEDGTIQTYTASLQKSVADKIGEKGMLTFFAEQVKLQLPDIAPAAIPLTKTEITIQIVYPQFTLYTKIVVLLKKQNFKSNPVLLWAHDYTVSEFIYKANHKYPILAIVAGGALMYYFPNDVLPIIVGILTGHFVWKSQKTMI